MFGIAVVLTSLINDGRPASEHAQPVFAVGDPGPRPSVQRNPLDCRRMSTKKRKRSRPSLDTPELAALANYIRERKCVLFVGAGLPRAAGLPDWGSLMRTIVDTTKLESATPEAAEELEALFDRGKYIELADQLVVAPESRVLSHYCGALLGTTVQPTELHRAIVETPYACIVTTNFDTLLEEAYARHSGRGLPRTPTGTELANQGTLLLDGAFFILKAHGTLQHAEEHGLYRRRLSADYLRQSCVPVVPLRAPPVACRALRRLLAQRSQLSPAPRQPAHDLRRRGAEPLQRGHGRRRPRRK